MSANMDIRRIVGNRLRGAGLTVTEADRTYDSMVKLKEKDISVVLMSNDAHDGDATCLAKFIVAHEPDIKVVLLSTKLDTDFIVNSRLRKSDANVYAPFNIEEILKQVA